MVLDNDIVDNYNYNNLAGFRTGQLGGGVENFNGNLDDLGIGIERYLIMKFKSFIIFKDIILGQITPTIGHLLTKPPHPLLFIQQYNYHIHSRRY